MKPQITDDLPEYDPPPIWIMGRAIWLQRSCGDCPNGTPCRYYDGRFMDSLDDRQRNAVQAWLTKAAEEGLFP